MLGTRPAFVEAIGYAATIFKRGDEVFYAGDISRPGSNYEFRLVDERFYHSARPIVFAGLSRSDGRIQAAISDLIARRNRERRRHQPDDSNIGSSKE